MSIKILAKKYTNLGDDDIEILERIDKDIDYMADLTNSDIFIDTFDKNQKVIVLAEACPRWAMSNYIGSVVGCEAIEKNEPAVYHSLQGGAPVKDIKAETQEGKTVKQDVIPIKNDSGNTIAVLIREKDISDSVNRDKKYNELVRERENHIVFDMPDFVSRETNHRIKNNLQVIVSTMRLQAKAIENKDFKLFFEKNIQRVLCVSAIHDILCNTEQVDMVEILSLLKRICNEISQVFGVESNIEIIVSGDTQQISSDIATAVAKVVNELVFNSAEHAFLPNEKGTILVLVQKGNQNLTITVKDNGHGFDVKDVSKNSLGLKIITQTVKYKLKSEFRIMSDVSGTKATFGFKIN